MNLIIFGPPGSGKGTQAEALSKKLHVPQITMGELFRGEISQQSAVGKKIELIINQGDLVDDQLTLEVLKKRLNQTDCQSGFILDGYPRTIPQAEALDQVVNIDRVLEVWISNEESIRRLVGRRSCPKCGAVYHLEFNPPLQHGKCDKCRTDLIIREDDIEEVIKKRLSQYHKQTEQLKEFYQKQGKLITIDGMPSILKVTEEIFKKI